MRCPYQFSELTLGPAFGTLPRCEVAEVKPDKEDKRRELNRAMRCAFVLPWTVESRAPFRCVVVVNNTASRKTA